MFISPACLGFPHVCVDEFVGKSDLLEIFNYENKSLHFHQPDFVSSMYAMNISVFISISVY